ncbi:MAG: 4-(cytidine 5'-diphospho)-2-C-methyl-D-erythritol kinase, partial [Hyphomicrobiales bacterium]|nr:4-(cytidine 5'-diphospho)-2-C-methyl-D-erythritol kinase [Hyphomicrobiales bacterium]
MRERARAKVNLTLRVLGRRADGMHDIESLVAFADVADGLSLSPGRPLSLVVTGRVAREVPADGDNLVLRAAAAFARLEPGTATGAFALKKRLPVAAGLGGGSADAAAALRALAILNGLAPGHPSVVGAAREVGADVPACLAGVACTMRGIGHEIEAHAIGAPIHAVLVNPGVAVATRDVFAGLGLAPGGRRARAAAPADFVGALETMAA